MSGSPFVEVGVSVATPLPYSWVRFVLVLFFWVGPVSSDSAYAAAAPFSATIEDLAVTQGELGALTVKILVPPGTLVYRDMIRVEVVDPGGVALGTSSLPPALKKPDPVSGELREVYDFDIWIEIPLSEAPSAGPYSVRVEAAWQGCKGTICYLPQTVELRANVDVAPAPPQTP